MQLDFEEVVLAYFDCRKGKRRSVHALEVEINLEQNLYCLYEDLKSGHYQIGRSIVFVVEQPKIREIWSATFRDRIVHHIIYKRLKDRFLPRFIRNSFACIPGRGTLDGSNRLMAGMRSVTNNWQNPAYYLGADIRNFFVSIDKKVLLGILKPRISEAWLLALVEQVLFHDPRPNHVTKSKSEVFARVPKHKSLWNTPLEKGLPIGNLTSQFFANVYLNELDQFVKHVIKTKYYYRYVDDLVLLHENSDYLNEAYEKICEFTQEQLKLEFHPFKKRIGLIYQGIDFVGYIHRPHRRYIRTRTLNRMKSIVNLWRQNPKCYNDYEMKQLRGTMNSYLGLIKWGSTYKLRKSLGDKLSSLFMRPDKNYEKLIIPNYLR